MWCITARAGSSAAVVCLCVVLLSPGSCSSDILLDVGLKRPPAALREDLLLLPPYLPFVVRRMEFARVGIGPLQLEVLLLPLLLLLPLDEDELV